MHILKDESVNQYIMRERRQDGEKASIKLKDWVNGFKANNAEVLKKHVVSFFISEGFYDVAVQFCIDAKIDMPQVNEEEIRFRYRIKRLIEDGKIDEGLSELKLRDQKIKDNNQHKITSFHLREFTLPKLQNDKQGQNPNIEKINRQLSPHQVQNVDENLNMEEPDEDQHSDRRLIDHPNQEIQSLLQQQIQISMPMQSQNQIQYQKNRENEQVKKDQAQQDLIAEQINIIETKNPFENGKNGELLFALKCLKVINLIKSNQIQQSIQVAKLELLPYTTDSEKNTQYIEKIQKLMSLIAFANCKQSPNYQLTTLQHRMKVASDLNNLLIGQSETAHVLSALVKLTKWCERRLNTYVNIPKLNLTTNQLYSSKHSN